MTAEHASWWTRAAQNLSHRGLLWLALTAVALSSLATSGAGATAGARLVAAWSAAATGKLKANAPGTAARLPYDANRTLPAQVHGPDGEAKRIPAGAAAVGLVITSASIVNPPAHEDVIGPTVAEHRPPQDAFQARAPPQLA
jgi:hypothetical protein